MTNQITLKVIPRNLTTQEERDDIVTLCTSAYGIDFGPIIDSYGADITHVLLRENNSLISHALWVTRWLQTGSGTRLCTAYVEAVATEPAKRGRGYASVVMQKIKGEISQFEIGGLSPSDHRFYTRLGWELWRGPLFIRQGNNLLKAPENDRAMILRLPNTPALDLFDSLSVEWREGEAW
jgi:aminoglycoside 2'-N-acetyltransferase I